MGLNKAQATHFDAEQKLGKNLTDIANTKGFYEALPEEQKPICDKLIESYTVLTILGHLIDNKDKWIKLPITHLRAYVLKEVDVAASETRAEFNGLPLLQVVVETTITKITNDLMKMLQTRTSLNDLKGFTKQAGLFGTPSVMTGKCPDHTTIRMMKCPDEDATYVCPLDGKKYDYNNGFTKANGEFVQGASIGEQVPDFLGVMY